MYLPRARVSKKFNYLSGRQYGNCNTSRKKNENQNIQSSISISNNQSICSQRKSFSMTECKKKGVLFNESIVLKGLLNQSEVQRKSTKKQINNQLQKIQKELFQLQNINAQLTKSTEKKYEQFYTQMGKIQHILQQKDINQRQMLKKQKKLQQQIQNIKKQTQERQNFIEQLQRDLNTLEQCQRLRNQMIAKINLQKQIKFQQQQQKLKQNQGIIQKLYEKQSVNIQTDFDKQQLQDYCQQQSSLQICSQEYKQTLKKAIQQEDQYYKLRNQLYEIQNQISLVTNQFNAYRIMKQIQRAQRKK